MSFRKHAGKGSLISYAPAISYPYHSSSKHIKIIQNISKQPPYLGGVLMALTLCRKKNSIGCQDHGFFSTNCQPTCHFSTNCQDNFCLQYASGSRTTSFKKYKKTLCREVFFAPFFSTMCQFFSSMRCPGFFRFFKKKLLFCQWWSRAHCRVFLSCFKSSEC